MLSGGNLAVQDGQRLNGSWLVSRVHAPEKWGALGRGVAFTFHNNLMGHSCYLQLIGKESTENFRVTQ